MSNRLTDRRVDLDLKQADVAREVGISQPLLSQWEKGQLSGVLISAVKLARRYGLPMEELFGPLVDASEASDDPVPIAPPRKASGTTPAVRTRKAS